MVEKRVDEMDLKKVVKMAASMAETMAEKSEKVLEVG